MKNISMPFYIAVGLSGVAAISIFIPINSKILVGLSLATLLFTVAQMIDSQINFWNEDTMKLYEVFTKLYNFNLKPENSILAKLFIKYREPSKKEKLFKTISPILYCMAFIALFVGLVFPFHIQNRIESAIVIFSTALLFFSIWIVDKGKKRQEQWDEVMMAVIMNKGDEGDKEVESKLEDDTNGQAEI